MLMQKSLGLDILKKEKKNAQIKNKLFTHKPQKKFK